MIGIPDINKRLYVPNNCAGRSARLCITSRLTTQVGGVLHLRKTHESDRSVASTLQYVRPLRD